MNLFNVVPRLFYVGLMLLVTMEMQVSQWVSGERLPPQQRVASAESETPMSTVTSTIESYHINMDDDYAIQQLAVIVDALENLNILDGKKRSCYMVDKMTKLTEQVDTLTQRIELAFYVSQPKVLTPRSKSGSGKNSSVDELTGSGCLDNNVGPGAHNDSGDRKSGGCGGGSGGERLIGVYEGMRGGKTQGTDNSITTQNVTSTSSNETVAQPESDSHNTPTRKEEEGDNLRGKLSHTQIMVISTCSTVIGLFFMVALGMRIRNYLKRKTESSTKRRGHLTSSSMAFRSSSHSPARTDSIVSKCGFPDSTTNIPVHSAHMNGSYPKNSSSLVAPDNKPLLVITSASAPSSPLVHSAFGLPHKNKVTHTPSAPAGGTTSKDYLTIYNKRYNQGTNGTQPTHNITATTNNTATTHNRHKPLTKILPPQHHHMVTPSNHNPASPDSTKLHFNEYFRDSSKVSSDSSLSGSNKAEVGSKPRKDSGTSNQSGYESSENTTDSSPQLDDTDSKYTRSGCNSDDVFEEPCAPSDRNNTQIIPSILTTRKEAQYQPPTDDDPEQIGLSPREKRSSSSSSYGRKSVSFSIDIEQKRSSTSSSDIQESAEEEQRQNESSLLLRAEFLGMQPTYV